MKISSLVVAAGCLFLGGCDSISNATDSVRDKLAAREETKTKTYPVSPKEAYEAVRTAAAQMGYRFVRGGAAQGTLEAVSGVSASDSLRGSRQVSMKVHLHAALDGGTEVSVQLTEIIEGDSSNRAGQATETPLRDTPQYEVFFRSVQQAADAIRKGR